jgi:hypothetical protein
MRAARCEFPSAQVLGHGTLDLVGDVFGVDAHRAFRDGLEDRLGRHPPQRRHLGCILHVGRAAGGGRAVAVRAPLIDEADDAGRRLRGRSRRKHCHQRDQRRDQSWHAPDCTQKRPEA